jgi:diadenosine tetraphosphate (Ap4A) HIT family hydrolase
MTKQIAERACPFDTPRPVSNEHWDFISTLSISSLYLSKNQTYRGHSLLMFDARHAVRLDELSAAEWSAFSLDLLRAINRVVRPDHMNVELLGNVVPHLHWHIRPRYRVDPRWGGPIWTTTPAEMTPIQIPREEQLMLVDQILEALASVQSDMHRWADRVSYAIHQCRRRAEGRRHFTNAS